MCPDPETEQIPKFESFGGLVSHSWGFPSRASHMVMRSERLRLSFCQVQPNPERCGIGKFGGKRVCNVASMGYHSWGVESESLAVNDVCDVDVWCCWGWVLQLGCGM